MSLICFYIFIIFFSSKRLLEKPMYQDILILIGLNLWMRNGSIFPVVSFMIWLHMQNLLNPPEKKNQWYLLNNFWAFRCGLVEVVLNLKKILKNNFVSLKGHSYFHGMTFPAVFCAKHFNLVSKTQNDVSYML